MSTAFKAVSTSTTEYTEKDILSFLIQSGNINMSDVEAAMKQAELEKIIKKYHPFAISQGKDGRYRTYINTDNGRKQIAKSTLEKLNTALYEHYKSFESTKSDNNATLENLYPVWLEYKRLHAASSTYMRRIASDWKNYYAGTEIVTIPIHNLTKLMLDVWSHQLIEQTHNSKKQFYNISTIMRQVLDWAVDAEIINENPLRKVRIDSRMVFTPERKKPSETQVFTKQEVESLYAAAWEEFSNGHNTIHKLTPLAVMFQFQTGIRIGELCVVRYEDIEGSEIYIQRMYRYEDKEVIEYTKMHHDGRYVPLTAEAKKLIETARQYQQNHGLDDAGYIFSVTDEPLSYYAVRKSYERYCDKIGTINKSSHKSRKTFISALIDGGVNINEIRQMVDHASETTTYKSYCYDRKTKSERIELIEKALA